MNARTFPPSTRRPTSRPASGVVLDTLEPRLLFASTRFAVIGDFSAGQPAQDVANLVQGWNPAFVVTVGDNNYPDGAASTIDANIGQYYHQYMSPYAGAYGAGAADGQNHLWPALGNHDWVASGAQPYLDYFHLSNNERYYDVQSGNVGLFVLDSDPHEPDGNSATSVQGNWLQNRLTSSGAKWKFVFDHHPPYSSGGIGSNTFMQWPFAKWGVSAVFSGHDHDYERLTENGIPNFVDGLGGESIVGFGKTVAGSQVRYAGDYGAMLVDAGDTSVTFQFITRSGKLIDTYTLGAPSTPAAPSGLTVSPVSSAQLNLSWKDNATSETGFVIERSTDGVNFTGLTTTGANVTAYADTGLIAGTTYTYRVSATSAAGSSPASAAVSGTTLPGDTSVTYVSDLTWVSAANGWGPVEKDHSNGSTPAGDGRTITLKGVTYTKGLGTNSVSTVVYNLAGAYDTFVSDLGIDDEEIGKGGSVTYQVIGDGKVLYTSALLKLASPTATAVVNVAGVQKLTLQVNDGGDGNSYDHADWAGARLLQSGAPSPPQPWPRLPCPPPRRT
jgi:tartrate-resistant acid phosphatase type 5